jgi:hypothetical protein
MDGQAMDHRTVVSIVMPAYINIFPIMGHIETMRVYIEGNVSLRMPQMGEM